MLREVNVTRCLSGGRRRIENEALTKQKATGLHFEYAVCITVVVVKSGIGNRSSNLGFVSSVHFRTNSLRKDKKFSSSL